MGYLITKLIDSIKARLFAEVINGQRYVNGMLPHEDDERDVQYGWMFGTPTYVPKNKVVDIQTITCRDQGTYNNCCFQAATVQKEIDEKVPLSVRYVTSEAEKRGRVVGNGLSSLRYAQQTIVDAGAAEQALLPEVQNDWESYADPTHLTYNVEMNGQIHKSKSFAQVVSKSDWIHALDNGRAIHTGLQWFTSYNMNNGFSAPWVITIGKGINVGGHSVVCRGYDLTKNLYKFQNSYSLNYGDKGCFYANIDQWHEYGMVGYVSVDADALPAAAYAFDGKDVKTDGDPRIYRIEAGKKRWYPDEKTYLSWGGTFNPPSFVRVASVLLNSIPAGDNMTIKL
jgi:hypothetical protein